MRFLIRWIVTAIAVAVAVLIIPGIDVYGPNAWLAILVGALILGFLNATLGLIIKIGAIGCVVMTLGLFNLVVNAGMLMLASWVSQNWFDLGFSVTGFWPAFFGGIVISIVSGMLNWFVPSDEDTE